MDEINETKVIRDLPKDQSGVLLPFTTKKGKYNVIRPGDPLGFIRWGEYERLSLVMGTGKTFSQLITELDEIEKMLGADRAFADIRVESILKVNSLKRGIIDLSKARFSKAFYQASVFIWRDGDDRLAWDMATAEDYIQDWAEEGLNEQDFFGFAALTVNGLIPIFRKFEAERRQTEVNLSGTIG
jgi:hypothetical protein